MSKQLNVIINYIFCFIDHASLFSVSNAGNIVTIQLNEQLPEEIIENHFMILEIEAIHPRTIKAHATIVVEIIRQLEPNIIPPVFERPYYYGEYSVEDKLHFNQTIQLREGSEENVSFELEGGMNSKKIIISYISFIGVNFY